ncbi:tetratricopeptide repeat protein [Allocoleopsis franciscana]|uniref:TPR repeat-containing protein n=1 Tax=Allocoleopsis franciscana PCC 7113 TaxID=1173027 RepID=K9W886_9CYAN|nr:tetratricopeptide repeat protein [Allocoleopsis franciscana]AFZ16575.1 TPR repeat-containing protein [Allocoleopsis franciscana PCC 7113]
MPTNEISTQGHFEQGNTLASQGDYQGALEEYNQALQLDPNFAYAYRMRSFIRHALGDYQEALEDCNMLFQLNCPLGEADAYYNRSLIRHAVGDYQGALEDCNRALQFLCQWHDTLLENIIQPVADFIADTLIRGLIALGETQEVVEDLDERWHRPCDKPNAYFRRGAIRSCAGDYQGALGDFTETIRLKPNANNYYNRGVTHYQMGNYQEAIADLTQTLQLKPNFVAAYYNRGNAKYDLGDEAGAFQDYNQAQAIAPNSDINSKDEHGYYGRALARSRMGDNLGALEDLNKAATLCSEHRNTALHQRVQEMIRTLSD